MDEDIKKPWKSKTLWVALLLAVAPTIPPLQVAIAANPELAGLIVAGVFGVLRLFTEKKIAVKG